MPLESMISDSIRSCLGKEGGPVVWEVDRQLLGRFTDATGDPNPLWVDERFARKTRFGGLIAPPAFLSALRVEATVKLVSQLKIPVERLRNGGSDIELFEPIRAGDVITVTGKLASATEKEGKEGRFLLFVFEWAYRNQLGDMAAKEIARLMLT